LKIRREIDDQPGIGGTLINLGNVSERRGRYDDALRYYKESLRIQQELGDQAYMGVCLSNIGSAYLDSGQYADALTYFQQALQVRQQLKVPAEIGKTLHNLGEAYLKSGHYDEALNYYLQAVELLRNAGDQHGAAEETLSMGMLFAEQGRYQAALQAQQDALNAMKGLNEHGYWMAFAQGSYGRALGLMARFDEAEKNLRDALALAQNLHQDALTAQLLKFQGDVFFYRGQYPQAQQYYGQALNTASKTTDRDLILISKASGAKAAVELGETQAPISVLRQASQEADRRGLKSVGAECALYLGKALLNAGNQAQARKQFETALLQSQTLGMKALQAQSHLLLAKAARLSGAASDASQHEDAARRLAADIRSEAKTDSITKRSDLAPLYNLTATK
jgi:tetratricopeptide (TPR) repeat protein